MTSSLKLKSSFLDRRALLISADKLTVYHWHKGELGSSYLFDTDESGLENFKRYLVEASKSPITIVVDVIEEEYRQETIPHVFGADRQALIERKQSRLFRDAAYFYTQDQGREEDGRRDDKLLFMSLTNRELLQPFLTLLDEHKVPVKGIISLPLLLQSYIKTLPDISDNTLFVSMQSISGLRQTFFHKKELRISRLSKLPRYGTEPYAPRIISEVEKIQRYLNSLRVVSGDQALNVYFLADKSTLDQLEQQTLASPNIHRHYLDINRLYSSQKEGESQTIPFCDKLLIHFLLKSGHKNCYATPHETRYNKMRNLRVSMNVLSFLLLVVGVAYSGFNFLGGLTYQQQSENAKNKAAFYQTRYDLARERLPKTPVEPAQVKVAVDAVADLKKYKSSPYETLTFLGEGLEKYPTIKLDSLDWTFSMNPDEGVNTVDQSNSSGIAVGTDSDPEKPIIKYWQISLIEAHIAPFDGDYREAIETVNNFAETLRSNELVHDVSIESFPLDISSDSTLQGDAKKVVGEALFSLRAVIGVEDEES